MEYMSRAATSGLARTAQSSKIASKSRRAALLILNSHYRDGFSRSRPRVTTASKNA
jgi:hypothetical protein